MIELTMTCQSTIQDSTGQGQGNAFLTAVSREETDGYFVYTPYGSLEIGLLTPEAFEEMIPGKTYRVTVELVD